LSGFFPSFARATGALSVAREYLALGDGPPGFGPGSTCPVLLRIPLGPFPCRLQDFHLLWSAIPDGSARVHGILNAVLQPHKGKPPWFGLFPFRSPLLRESLLLSLPPGTEMFQFPGLATCTYGFSARRFGNLGIDAPLTAPPSFSQFFHALHRLLAPRHPPHALTSLATLS
jgi:hypothetical protein